MSEPDPVLDLIDHALRDYETSADAMHWTPDGQKTAAAREAGSNWTAWCAPGRRAITEIVLFFYGENVTAIEETAALQGSDIVLVNQAAIAGAIEVAMPPFEFTPLTGLSARPPMDPLRFLCEDMARKSLREQLPLMPLGV
jgi:hypothetical protein